MPTGDQAVDHANWPIRPQDEIRPAVGRMHEPLVVVADSRARVAVVPTAITRPPVACVRFTNRAVVSGTSNSSATGGSPASAEETPACSVIGAIVMPDVIREVSHLGLLTAGHREGF